MAKFFSSAAQGEQPYDWQLTTVGDKAPTLPTVIGSWGVGRGTRNTNPTGLPICRSADLPKFFGSAGASPSSEVNFSVVQEHDPPVSRRIFSVLDGEPFGEPN